jgi:hypothetical protein
MLGKLGGSWTYFSFRVFVVLLGRRGRRFCGSSGRMVAAPKTMVPSQVRGSPHDHGRRRQRLGFARVPPVRNALLSAGVETRADRGTGFRFWFSLLVGLLVCGSLALGLAQADHSASAPAAPAERRALPPSPAREHPYVPQIRIGAGQNHPILGVLAPSRGSAAFWRSGEASLTAAAFFSMSTGRRV